MAVMTLSYISTTTAILYLNPYLHPISSVSLESPNTTLAKIYLPFDETFQKLEIKTHKKMLSMS